jgi:hypothetical protein
VRVASRDQFLSSYINTHLNLVYIFDWIQEAQFTEKQNRPDGLTDDQEQTEKQNRPDGLTDDHEQTEKQNRPDGLTDDRER